MKTICCWIFIAGVILNVLAEPFASYDASTALLAPPPPFYGNIPVPAITNKDGGGGFVGHAGSFGVSALKGGLGAGGLYGADVGSSGVGFGAGGLDVAGGVGGYGISPVGGDYLGADGSFGVGGSLEALGGGYVGDFGVVDGGGGEGYGAGAGFGGGGIKDTGFGVAIGAFGGDDSVFLPDMGAHGATGGSGGVIEPAPCQAGVKYVTTYLTQVQEVPKYEVVYKQQFLTTIIYEPIYKTVTSVKYETVLKTELITNTIHKTNINFVSETKPIYKTIHLPFYITTTEFHTQYHKTNALEYVTKLKVDILTTTQKVPKPTKVIETEVRRDTVYITIGVPQYQTVYQTKYDVQTVCPNKNPLGYGG